MVNKLLEDADDIGKLISLNDYVNKIKIGSPRNLILAHDLGLSQVLNWVSIENYFSKSKLILARDLEMQVTAADITKNFSVKPFLEGTQVCLILNLKENTNKLASLKKTFQSTINFFSTLFSPTTLLDSLYLTSLTNSASNSAIGLLLDLPRLVLASSALAQLSKPWKLPKEKPQTFLPKLSIQVYKLALYLSVNFIQLLCKNNFTAIIQ